MTRRTCRAFRNRGSVSILDLSSAVDTSECRGHGKIAREENARKYFLRDFVSSRETRDRAQRPARFHSWGKFIDSRPRLSRRMHRLAGATAALPGNPLSLVQESLCSLALSVVRRQKWASEAPGAPPLKLYRRGGALRRIARYNKVRRRGYRRG